MAPGGTDITVVQGFGNFVSVWVVYHHCGLLDAFPDARANCRNSKVFDVIILMFLRATVEFFIGCAHLDESSAIFAPKTKQASQHFVGLQHDAHDGPMTPRAALHLHEGTPTCCQHEDHRRRRRLRAWVRSGPAVMARV